MIMVSWVLKHQIISCDWLFSPLIDYYHYFSFSRIQFQSFKEPVGQEGLIVMVVLLFVVFNSKTVEYAWLIT